MTARLFAWSPCRSFKSVVFICLGRDYVLFFKLIIKPHPYLVSSGLAVAENFPAPARRGSLRLAFSAGRLFVLLVLTPILVSSAKAQSPSATVLSNLTLGNLFSEGWDQPWIKRPNPDGAPDMALLRVQTNFLSQYVRADFFSEQGLTSTKNQVENLANFSVGKSLNRRFMTLAYGYYEWLEARTAIRSANAFNFALAERVQLIDIPGAAYDFNLKVTSPAKQVGSDLTTLAYSFAGWQDLTPYGLSRVGLYFSVLGDNYVGPHPLGAKETDVIYDATLAKTWTEPTANLQNLTTFAEFVGQTDLGGSFSGKTVVVVTPGFRFGIGHNQFLMAGVDLPISHPRPYSWGLRLTYIFDY